MNISSEKTDLKKTYLAIVTMLLAILCVDMYMVVIKFLGNEYTVIQLAVFRNIAGVIPLFILILFALLIVPYVAIVDTGLIGNLDNASYFGAPSIAASTFAMFFGSCSFLR